MDLPLISIIIPVYNVERYLVECLESIKNQTYEKIEVILIDDGSKDRSGEICDKYMKNDARFIVVHQNNQGVSAARNVGLEKCRGEYVMFVDSDDWLEEECCEILVNNLSSQDIDALLFDLWYEHENYSYQSQALKKLKTIFLNEEIEELKIATIPFRNGDTEENMVFFGPYCKLLKRKCVERIRFIKELKYGEDAIFNFEAFSEMKAIKCLNYNLYHYRKNSDSVTGKFKIDRNQQSILRLKYTFASIQDKYDVDFRYAQTFNEMYVNIVLYLLNNIINLTDISLIERWNEINYLANNQWMQKMWHVINGNIHILNLLFSGNKVKIFMVFVRVRFL